MRILVTGGAGYIGSHAVRWLIKAGHEPIVFDNLEIGHVEAVPAGLLRQGDLSAPETLAAVFQAEKLDAVMHFAAYASVPQSVTDPALYYRNNVLGTLNLLDAMRAAGVWRIVFSSTCAIYGNAEVPIREASPKQPINPYGFTKLVMEQALADYAAAYGFGYAALRYFNACGAADDGSIGEDHTPETHLIPLVLQAALGQRKSVSVFGTDYPTPDGTCVRDYIHVDDLADAHVRVLAKLERGKGLAYNVGTGSGFSVRQVIEAARRVTGRPIETIDQPRRAGDPAVLVASPEAVKRDLGWSPRYTDIDAIIRSSWSWHSSHPQGYATSR